MRFRLLKCLQILALLGLGNLLIYLLFNSTIMHGIESDQTKNKGLNAIENIPTIEPELFQLRQTKIRRLCQNVNKTAVKLPRTILYSRNMNTAYCPVTYIASTTTKYALLSTEGKSVRVHRLYQMSYEHGIQMEAQKLAIRRNLDNISGKANLLLVVRDPWQRLVTAYRRLTDITSPSYDMKWCYSALELDEMNEMTFNRFLDCLIKKREVQKLYLQPISEVCAICRIDYDKIVRLENLMPELKTFYDHVDIKYRESTGKFLAAINSAPTSRGDNYDITPYLQTVTIENQQRIQEVYKDDFSMFGYTYLNEFDPDLSHKL